MPIVAPRFDGGRPDCQSCGFPNIVSQPLDGETFFRGEIIEIAYDWTKDVVVNTSGGLPALRSLFIGDRERLAHYVAGRSTTRRSVFEYTVQAEDSTQGNFPLEVRPGTLIIPPGSSITDLSGNAAVPYWLGVGGGLGFDVDGSTAEARSRVTQTPVPSPTTMPTATSSPVSCINLQPYADLNGCDFSERDMRGINLEGADLRNAVLERTDLSDANLTGADLSGAVLTKANLKNAVMANAKIREASAEGIDLTNVDLSSTDISQVRSFNDATLFRTIFAPGVQLSEVTFVRTELSRSHLVGAILVGADFTRAKSYLTDLTRANLKDAVFRTADLDSVIMESANLHGAIFVDADLSESYLSNANFQGANIKDADFSKADLTGANFSDAKNADDAIFRDTVCSDGVTSNRCYSRGSLHGIQP